MIEKERLDELIEQGATIYEVKYGKVNPVSLKNKIRFVSDRYPVVVFEPRPNEKYKHHKYFDKLFESREDAEWVAKYHTTRVERFEPPTYEEFIDEDFYFYWFIAKSTQRARICKKDNSIFVELGVDENLYEFQLNKDGYIKAVELSYKLFKGESEDEKETN